ncbi:hypothetical protein NQ315_006260, partial [Exocentrus adspersus]
MRAIKCSIYFSVKSKPGALEDTYGDLVGSNDEGVQNDEYDEDYPIEEDDTGDVPEESVDPVSPVLADFKTKPQLFIAKMGEVVRLPCEITNPDLVLVWKKDENQLLYQGDFPIRLFSNINKTSGGLEVTVTSHNDYGKYSCQMMISTNNSPMITHSIVPPTPPKITSVLPEGNKTVYEVGESLKLTCLATGYPKPKISWFKGSERLGIEGETIRIPDLKAKSNGVYRCLADNKVSEPAHSHIIINVQHKPVISIDKYIVNSDKENDAELKCTVHAYPSPVVVWKKNGMNIKADPPKVVFKRHQNNVENILIIANLTEADFGEYSCSAVNNLGKVEETVSLVKTPAVRGFVKPEKANKDVVLTWKVESKSPITEHQLQYRRKGEEEWKTLKPEVTNDGDGVYTMKYTLKGLEPGSYETRARSQNSHGWSEYSDIMPFEGVLAKNGSHHKQHNKKHHKDMK